MPATIALLVALAVLTALFHLLAALLDRSGRIRLRHWAEEAGGAVRALYDRPHQLSVFRAVLAGTASALPVVLLLVAWRLFGAPLPAVGCALAVVAVAEATSRVIVNRFAEEGLRALTVVYRVVLLPLLPLLALLAAPLRRRRRDAIAEPEEDEASEDEIEAFLDVGAAEGILEPGEEDLVARVIDFGDTVVRSVITPRIDMVCAPLDADLDEVAELFLESHHSRIPIYRGSVDQIVGILHIRDLLAGLRAAGRPPLVRLASRPYFVPDTKPLNELLKELQSRRQQIAIVVDEFGGTLGLVTLEDVLEEIVGDIVDEHEEAAADWESVGDGVWRLDGGAYLEVLEELFDVDVAAEPYETVGGLVFGLLGDVPRVGDRVARHGLEFTVEQVSDRRVRKVLARRAAAGDAA